MDDEHTPWWDEGIGAGAASLKIPPPESRGSTRCRRPAPPLPCHQEQRDSSVPFLISSLRFTFVHDAALYLTAILKVFWMNDGYVEFASTTLEVVVSWLIIDIQTKHMELGRM